jgi:uncharacterized DUF497 family protein
MRSFRWNGWNLDHATKHGVEPREAEEVVRTARNPYPRDLGDGRYLVWGQASGGRLVQVIFIEDLDRTVYVIHARPLTESEKRRYRRTRRHEP